jgi:hypothetical protein
MVANSEIDDFADIHLCSECIDHEEFSNLIKSEGTEGTCDFAEEHGNENPVMDIEAFAHNIDEYIRDNYCIGEEYVYAVEDSDKPQYATYGDTLDEIISHDLGCYDGSVAEAILSALIHNDNYDVRDGGEPFYDDLRNYEPVESVANRREMAFEDYWYENRVSFQWQDFCKSVIYDTRFFNIKKQLDDLFGKIEEYTREGRRPVYTIGKGKTIFRARKLSRNLDGKAVKDNPKKELGAPPADIAIAGRMNVQHIPAFYAAFSPEVAMRELQPYISEQIAVGEFTLERNIRVFDFTVFDTLYDEKYAAKGIKPVYTGTSYDVVTKMQNEISRPVSSDNKTREYIPTQVLTEYIQEHFDVDAIIFFSSLFPEEHEGDNRNIVLLSKRFEGGKFESALSIDKKKVQIKSVTNIHYEAIDIADLPF